MPGDPCSFLRSSAGTVEVVVTLLALVAGSLALPPRATEIIHVPRGTDVTIDGRVLDHEWADARRLSQGGTSLYLKHSGPDLLLAMQSDGLAISNVCLGLARTVNVFHSSASLGMAAYRRSGDDTWQRNSDFAWQRPMDSAQGDNYYRSNLWVASTAADGDRTREFRIARRMFGDSIRITISVSPMLSAPTLWPATGSASDTCRGNGIAFGTAPEVARFEPSQWDVLAFSP